MIQPASKNIKTSTVRRLKDLQKRINDQPTFKDMVKKAQSLWKSKSGSKVGKAAFEDIKQTLIDMCVSVEVCNYCEQNEANDIEHISPKSFFPKLTFVWLNYLLACAKCNTILKSDKCYVLDANDNTHFVKRGTQPPHPIYAFINPRLENPNDFLILNMQTFEFELMPGLNKKDTAKAEKTLEILQLNERSKLLEARESAAKYYYDRIERLVNILNSRTLPELKSHLTPYDTRFDFSQNITTIKAEIKTSFKNNIQIHQHPSVWHAIKKVESMTNSNWKNLFNQIPEALTW